MISREKLADLLIQHGADVGIGNRFILFTNKLLLINKLNNFDALQQTLSTTTTEQLCTGRRDWVSKM